MASGENKLLKGEKMREIDDMWNARAAKFPFLSLEFRFFPEVGGGRGGNINQFYCVAYYSTHIMPDFYYH